MPAVRRPKPIPKPSISISTDASGHSKEWIDTIAMDTKAGDLVLGKNRGLLMDVEVEDISVVLVFKNGNRERVFHDTPVRIFTESRG